MRAGVHGNLLRWIDSYIRNRSQAVCLKGYRSDFLNVPSGVPQGSHLGPLLFSIYINDIGDSLNYANHLLYADDTKLYRIITSLSDCKNLQNDLNALTNYCSLNQLYLNQSKCSIITYTRKNRPIHYNYTISNNSLQRVSNIRDLGVIMDSRVSFNLHIDSIVQRAYKSLGFINRMTTSFRSSIILRILYFAHVRSVLDFCSVVWSPHYKCHIERIERVQKKFIRIMNFRNGHGDTTYKSSLNRYKMLSLSDRRELTDMVFLFKILLNKIDSPTLLSNIPFLVPSRRPARSSRKKHLFSPPLLRKNYTCNCFLYRSLNVYNDRYYNVDPYTGKSLAVLRSELAAELKLIKYE